LELNALHGHKEGLQYILSERVHNLEKNIEFVIDWLEEISPDLRKANQRKQAYGVQDNSKD